MKPKYARQSLISRRSSGDARTGARSWQAGAYAARRGSRPA